MMETLRRYTTEVEASEAASYLGNDEYEAKFDSFVLKCKSGFGSRSYTYQKKATYEVAFFSPKGLPLKLELEWVGEVGEKDEWKLVPAGVVHWEGYMPLEMLEEILESLLK